MCALHAAILNTNPHSGDVRWIVMVKGMLIADFESEAELNDSERHMSRPWGLHDKLYFPQLNSISV